MSNDLLTLPFILVLVGIAIIIAVIVLAQTIKRTKEKRDALLEEQFGKAPEYTDYEIDEIGLYHHYAAQAHPSENLIDTITWNDLNMDDVFRRINSCHCNCGEEYLYHQLHELIEDDEVFEHQEAFFSWLESHPEERLTLQKILLKTGKRKNNRLSYYVFHSEAERIGHTWLFVLLALLPIVGVCLIPISMILGIVFAICAVAVNIILYYVYRLTLETGLESMRSFSALLHSAKLLHQQFGTTLEQFGYGLAAAMKPFRSLGGLVSGTTQQNLAELEAISIIIKSIFLVDLITYNRSIEKLSKYKQEFSLLYNIMGKIDANLSILSFRHSLPHFCSPVFTDQKEILFDKIYHPLLQHPVTNDGHIGQNAIITGSNASGKSTFIKALAINNILAQTIHTCCAKRYELKPCYVATSMALRDDILSGDSYFVTEIKSLKRIIDFCNSHYCTCFVDEILRGTNTPERIAASTAVLRYLNQTESLCVIASHDIELAEIMGESFDNYHFCEIMDGKTINFDYLLKQGPSTTTNAIKLLETIGFDPAIIQEANQVLKQ